jgi:hypothetical protein
MGEPPLPREGGLIKNGGFEKALRNGGLDWRLGDVPGSQIGLDEFVFKSGTRSLRVEFDGTTNVAFFHVQQWVPVEPNRRYRFQASLKTENISTDQGLFLSILPQGPPGGSGVLSTKGLVGTMAWTQERLDFGTGPGTSVVLIQLRREPSAKLNNLLQGKVWIDDVFLEPLGP